MDKGKGGKGKKGTSWARAPGTRPYLNNFRKGLRFQRERALREMEAAPDVETACDRWSWVPPKEGFVGLWPRNGLGQASHAAGQADALWKPGARR